MRRLVTCCVFVVTALMTSAGSASAFTVTVPITFNVPPQNITVTGPIPVASQCVFVTASNCETTGTGVYVKYSGTTIPGTGVQTIGSAGVNYSLTVCVVDTTTACSSNGTSTTGVRPSGSPVPYTPSSASVGFTGGSPNPGSVTYRVP